MKPNVKSKLDSIFNYPFFQSVGKPLPPTVTKLDNWPAAAKSCRSHKWDNCTLMARNALQGAIQERFPEGIEFWHRSEEWNPLAQELRPIIHSFIDTLLPKIPVSEKGKKKIKDTLSWDIMGICFEQEYSDIVEPIFFLPVLDPWYAAGHFPCGWDGDEFPEHWDGKERFGQLIIF